MPNGVKITPLDSLLMHIFSLACFQRKFSCGFLSFVGPNTQLEWREFFSALETIFKNLPRMPEGVILTPCIEMLRKVVRRQKVMILFLCFEAEFQFTKPFVFLKQLESFSAVKYLCNCFISFLSVEYLCNSLFGCDIVSKLLLCLLRVNSSLWITDYHLCFELLCVVLIASTVQS